MQTRKFFFSLVWLLLGLSITTACTASTPPPPTLPSAPTIIVPSTANPQEIPLPTLLPTVAIPDTAIPVTAGAVTAVPVSPIPVSPIPVTAAPGELQTIPTVTPIPVTATRAAVVPTRSPFTNTPAAPAVTATPLPEGTPRVFVTALRVEPATPKADVAGTFFATFRNVSAENQGFRWAVEIWDAEDNKRFGLTTPENSTMVPGDSTHATTGWLVKGLGECRAYRGRVVSIDEEDNRTTFLKPDGGELWLDFSVCP